MEHLENSTQLSTHSPLHAQAGQSSGTAYLYILIVISFYGVFLCGIMLGYFHSKRKEKRRTNIFTRLVHEEEKREWGTLPKKHSLCFPGEAVTGVRSLNLALPFSGNHGNPFGHLRHEGGALPSPLACALCTEQSSVSSLCSSADTRVAIEEESDSGSGESPDETPKVTVENRREDSG
ncbi:potassium voltage-gated channel subfamily E member 4 [Syngnathus typhle]|uniref:potassium voltage-gated channel subfamily E member 4 n=1 Tax=Syngnathus typhle TaxID=161592 RepID=UPI002A69E581|nr:potassium voltage-gated channel subfamily E member 4 [Syngnathus typhle]